MVALIFLSNLPTSSPSLGVHSLSGFPIIPLVFEVTRGGGLTFPLTLLG
jgi:hypothetical protein